MTTIHDAVALVEADAPATGFWRAMSCSHPAEQLVIDPEGDRICCSCGSYQREPDLEADMLRAMAAIRRGF